MLLCFAAFHTPIPLYFKHEGDLCCVILDWKSPHRCFSYWIFWPLISLNPFYESWIGFLCVRSCGPDLPRPVQSVWVPQFVWLTNLHTHIHWHTRLNLELPYTAAFPPQWSFCAAAASQTSLLLLVYIFLGFAGLFWQDDKFPQVPN